MPPSGSEGGRTAAVCRFHSGGFCAKGGSCPYRHEVLTEQPANVHIPAAHREAYERAIRSLSSSCSSGSSPGPSGATTPISVVPSGRTPPASPAPGAPSDSSASPGPVQTESHPEARLRNVIAYFAAHLLSPRRRDPGGAEDGRCLAAFERFLTLVMGDHMPLYDSFVSWCERFNEDWGPNGKGVSKWLSHKRLGPFLSGKLGFQWCELPDMGPPCPEIGPQCGFYANSTSGLNGGWNTAEAASEPQRPQSPQSLPMQQMQYAQQGVPRGTECSTTAVPTMPPASEAYAVWQSAPPTVTVTHPQIVRMSATPPQAVPAAPSSGPAPRAILVQPQPRFVSVIPITQHAHFAAAQQQQQPLQRAICPVGISM